MANEQAKICDTLAKSLEWCEGTSEYAGIRSRVFYVPNSWIAKYAVLPRDEKGRPTSSVLEGEFVLLADKKWLCIDILPDKSQLTSEPQGEDYSQTQLNKLVAVHPGVGPEATIAAGWINNASCTFIVQDIKGRFRVLGNEMYRTKAKVNQDNGQGAAGSASTTINVEVTDFIPAPFYEGPLETEFGTINAPEAA